ncbi:MAG: hypothetical protein JXA09_02505, partial [Anaerolineae bacterium]|nr:hypothetical protein [Anaerolineae bacterium]
MFDNFGLGEFFFLAVLALLFFGPERLPQMGARLGRWVSRMTQYSKAFMTEWREEALAIHDAVAEVKGIRDEIVAAQAEISSTLQTARGDMNEGLEAAKEAVSGATRDVTDRMRLQQETAAQDLERAARERDGTAREAGDGEAEAIAKTQQILADLQQKRGAGTPDQAATAAPAESAEPEATEPAPADEEWESVRRLIEESLQPRPRADAQPAAVPEPAAMPEPAAAPEAAAMPEPAATPEPGVASEPVAASEPAATAQPEPPKESAFDRTQKILDGLMARRAGGERAEAKPAASGPSAAQAPAEGTPAEQTPAERTLA